MARPGRKRKVQPYTATAEWRPSLLSPSATPRQGKRTIDLFALCCWAYGAQKAHRLLRTEYDWFLFDLGNDPDLADCEPRPVVSKDAAAVHRAVVSLPREQSAAIIRFALEGDAPEPPSSMPQVDPLWYTHGMRLGPDDRTSWIIDNGERRQIVVSVEERCTEFEPIVERRGGRMVVVGQRPLTPIPVEYCPITYSPDPEWVRMELHAYETWRRGMAALWSEMQDAKLKDHALTGWNDPGPAERPRRPVIRDARDLARPQSFDANVGVGNRFSPSQGKLCRLHARASVVS